MKKKFARSLALLLMLSLVLVSAVPSFAADTVTTASPAWVDTTAAPVTTVKPAPAATAPAPMVKGQVYVVVSGDAIWKIAAKYKLTVKQLAALNPQIKNLNLIYVGQKITVNGSVAPAPAPTPIPTTGSKKVYQGLGYKVNFRNGPGADSQNVPVYSFNVAMADATFDSAGRIVNVFIDGYEVATPNYDGASMPHFSGWPGIEGYNVTDHVTTSVSGISVNTLESATAEVNGWLTKRQRGDSYDMNPANEWYKQMNFYQNFFKGKTVAEIQAWIAKYTTAATRPIKASTTNAADLAKYNSFTSAEKAALADVVSGATMAVNDVHGQFIDALALAYKNRVEVIVK